MPLTALIASFEDLKNGRRQLPSAECLSAVGAFGKRAHALVGEKAHRHSIPWQGQGAKAYSVYSLAGNVAPWSRAVNDNLFISDPGEFDRAWDALEAGCNEASGTEALTGLTADEVNQATYTAVMSWAVGVDLLRPSNGRGGRFFEMLVGPIISILSGRTETGDVIIQLPGDLGTEVVKVDLTFHNYHTLRSLAVPTKISTRERISQAYVHAAILNSAFPGQYKTALCVVNENNAFHLAGTTKAQQSVNTLFLRDTLVPGTIALYQKYIAAIDGLFYLDPPHRYVNHTPPGFPRVASFGEMLITDLPYLLT